MVQNSNHLRQILSRMLHTKKKLQHVYVVGIQNKW